MILLVVAVNWFFTVKRPQDTPVLQVNSRVFRWSEYITLLRFQKLAAEHLGGQFQAGQEPYTLMQLMSENELIRQASAREGLRIPENELHDEESARLVPNFEQIKDPAALARERELRVGVYIDAVQLTREQYDDIVRSDLLRRQLSDKLGQNIPRVQPQVSIHVILGQQEQAEAIQKQLSDGVPFETAARRFSQEGNVEGNGGNIGWVPRSVYPDLDSKLFGWKLGEVGEAIETPEGWWLVRVAERSADGARLQGIRLADLDTVNNVQTRLRAGASFTDLAAEFSTDASTRNNQGDMGIVRVGERGPDFDQAIRGFREGELIGPVMTHNVAYFAIVQERSPAQEIASEHFETLKLRALEDWLTKERAGAVIDYCPADECFGSIKVDRALKEIATQSLTRAQEYATATARAALSQQQPQF